MLTLRKSEERGHQEHGWLTAKHTFSFAQYYDPNFMGFSDLLVINEDLVRKGRGFRTHPHDNMEIFTYILEGALQHQDSMGFTSVIRPGDIQLMSAGSGIQHSEINASSSESVHLLQIWIKPNQFNIKPSYQQVTLDPIKTENALTLVISPDGQADSLKIHQNCVIYVGKFNQAKTLSFEADLNRYYYVHLAKGEMSVNGIQMKAGDGLKVTQEAKLDFDVKFSSEFLLFDLNSEG